MTYLGSKFPIDPPVSLATSQGVHMSFTGSTATGSPLYADRVGRWFCYWHVAGSLSPTADNQTLYMTAYLNGGGQGGSQFTIGYFQGTPIDWGFGQYRDLNTGDYIFISATNTYWCDGSLTFTTNLIFVPTVTHPR